MTETEKSTIDSMRRNGISLRRIAHYLGVNENTVKSYCIRNPLDTTRLNNHDCDRYRCCKNCGVPVPQIAGRKEKLFCSDSCRNYWWNHDENTAHRESKSAYVCPVCGGVYIAYPNRNRKYCSHECYIEARFGGVLVSAAE